MIRREESWTTSSDARNSGLSLDPILSIIIPSHNRPDLLRTCLNTVTRYAPARTEIIVVDDGCPGGEVEAVAASFGGVRVLCLPGRRGFCAAANAGIEVARGTIVELLNDDTEVTPGWADAALLAFEDPAVAAVAPLVLCHPAVCQGDGRAEFRIDSAGDTYYVGGVARKRGHRQLLNHRYLERSRVFGASASSAFYRRDVLLEVEAFSESFGAYFEDVDLAFRLHWAGYDVVFEPHSRVLHRISSSYGRPNRRLLEQQSRNEERVFWRNLPASILPRALPRHVAALIGKAHRRWEEGTFLPFFFGRLCVLGEISAISRHRRQLRDRFPSICPSRWGIDTSLAANFATPANTAGRSRSADCIAQSAPAV
jgi:GT2 family glycosyltransferase